MVSESKHISIYVAILSEEKFIPYVLKHKYVRKRQLELVSGQLSKMGMLNR